MEVGVAVLVNTDSASSASPDIPSEFQRENGDGDEQGWPLPVVASRVDCPDGAVDISADAPLPPAESEQPDAREVVQLTSQRKPRVVRTLISCFSFFAVCLLSRLCTEWVILRLVGFRF